MAETPNPTPDELFAALPNHAQRASVAQRELVRRLQANLPGLIAKVNEVQEREGRRLFTMPRIRVGPLVMADGEDYVDTVVVAISVQKVAVAPRRFKNVIQAAISWINRRADTEEQIGDAFDQAELIDVVLHPFINGCRDDQDRWCWRQAVNEGITPLPEGWEEYCGTVNRYTLMQHPPDNNWNSL